MKERKLFHCYSVIFTVSYKLYRHNVAYKNIANKIAIENVLSDIFFQSWTEKCLEGLFGSVDESLKLFMSFSHLKMNDDFIMFTAA